MPKLVQYLPGFIIEYKNINHLLSRIIAVKPQDADVERLINKPTKVTCIVTKNIYIFIHFNIPSLENCDPRPAVRIWFKQNERHVKATIYTKSQEVTMVS